jgi:hypothetical protein
VNFFSKIFNSSPIILFTKSISKKKQYNSVINGFKQNILFEIPLLWQFWQKAGTGDSY